MIEDPKSRRAIALAARALASILEIEDLPPDIVDALVEAGNSMIEALAESGAQIAAYHLLGAAAAELDSAARPGVESLRNGRAITKAVA